MQKKNEFKNSIFSPFLSGSKILLAIIAIRDRSIITGRGQIFSCMGKGGAKHFCASYFIE
jgi:hypothetical protein